MSGSTSARKHQSHEAPRFKMFESICRWEKRPLPPFLVWVSPNVFRTMTGPKFQSWTFLDHIHQSLIAAQDASKILSRYISKKTGSLFFLGEYRKYNTGNTPISASLAIFEGLRSVSRETRSLWCVYWSETRTSAEVTILTNTWQHLTSLYISVDITLNFRSGCGWGSCRIPIGIGQIRSVPWPSISNFGAAALFGFILHSDLKQYKDIQSSKKCIHHSSFNCRNWLCKGSAATEAQWKRQLHDILPEESLESVVQVESLERFKGF